MLEVMKSFSIVCYEVFDFLADRSKFAAVEKMTVDYYQVTS